jgi:hypothetical protein
MFMTMYVMMALVAIGAMMPMAYVLWHLYWKMF